MPGRISKLLVDRLGCACSLSFALSLPEILIWLAFVSVMLLLAVQLVTHFGPSQGLLVDKTRLRILAMATTSFLLLMIALTVYSILLG